MSEALKQALEEAKVTIREQRDVIDQLTAPPLVLATVLADGTDELFITVDGGRIMSVQKPVGTYVPGKTVLVHAETMQIVKLAEFPSMGTIGSVTKVIDTEYAEVDIEGSPRVVSVGRLDVEEGDRVLLDPANAVLTKNLGKAAGGYTTENPLVNWTDIGGLHLAKRELQEAIDASLFDSLREKYQRKPIKGVLLYGPPGCGKTMLAKAVGTEIAARHDGEMAGFIYMKGPEILSQWVGVAEARVREVFARAREFQAVNGYAPVIFIDEADAILGKRGSGISSDMEKTIVPTFLSEWDGITSNDALVLLATNRQDTLDPAVVRDGRVDRRIKVTRPSADVAQEIFKIHLGPMPMSSDLDRMAQIGTEAVFSDDRRLYTFHLKDGTTRSMPLSGAVNGAMVAGIVDRAAASAERRDRQAKRKRASGVTEDDLLSAVDAVTNEIGSMDNEEAIGEYVEGWETEVRSIRRAYA